MKSIKIILIAVEIAAIVSVMLLAFSKDAVEFMGHYFHAAYITGFAILAVVMQREQQAIEWDEQDESGIMLTGMENVEL